MTPGKWAHVAGTLRGGTLRIYYDGVLRDKQDLGTFFGRNGYGFDLGGCDAGNTDFNS